MDEAVNEPRRGSARWWDERYAAAELWWSVEPNRFVVEECSALAPGRALDLACGEGRNALWLAGRGWQVTAVDFSTAALDKARALGEQSGAHVDWVAADVSDWLARGSTDLYNLVVLAYLQVHGAERRQVLAAAAGVTAPGGSLLVVAHDLRNLTEGTGGPQDPDLLWTVQEVTRPGFTPARTEVAARPVDGPVERATAWDTVVRLVGDS